MIDRDPNLDREQKQRKRDSLSEVLRFCNNKTDCRRKQVLRFFNEDFDPVDCEQGCDVCLSRDDERYTHQNVAEDAVKVIKMVQAFGRDDRITQNNAVDCFRGNVGQHSKALNLNPHYGVGKDWSKSEAERLMQTLLLEGILSEYYTANGAGWSNAYLKVRMERGR
jgi:bloom syndrome protein